MTTSQVEQELTTQTFEYGKHVEIAAPVDVVFDAILAELGPEGQMPDGTPFPMTLEAWPGGRWFRDLGNDAGHLWGHVQVIKPPKLLEISGPMFVSYPVANHVQYRLTPNEAGTVLQVSHRAFGYLPQDFLEGAETGWEYGLKRINEIAQRLLNERGARR